MKTKQFRYNKPIRKILCIQKTGYEVYVKKNSLRCLPRYKLDFLREGYSSQKKAEHLLRLEAKKHKILLHVLPDTLSMKANYSQYDLIMTLGGDGTFLTTAQYCHGTPLLGLNSYPHTDSKKGSIGALTTCSFPEIPFLFACLQKGEITSEKWHRLAAFVDGHQIPGTAVNEIFFGPVEQDKICDFQLTVGRQQEIFASSGIIVCTSHGSSGWFSNAGGKTFRKKAMGFLVREPNKQRHPAFTQGKIPLTEEIILETGGGNTFLSFDSRKEHRYFLGKTEQKITIRKADHDLQVLQLIKR